MGYDIFKFGALYLGDEIQHVPQRPTTDGDICQYNGTAISVGPAEQEKSITWIKPNGSNLLVADRILLTDATCKDLDRNGFIKGRTVLIDGQRFLCRMLRVGKKKEASNEWDNILDITGEDNSLWHWEGIYFWGAEVLPTSSHHAVRGFLSARYWHDYHALRRDVGIGFRPVLEPLGPDNLKSNYMLDGTNFCLSSIPGGNGLCPILQPAQKDVFTGIPDGRQVRMYTIMEDGHPIHVGEPTKDLARLTLTDRYFGDEYLVSWVISNGIAVASQSLPQQGDCQKERK